MKEYLYHICVSDLTSTYTYIHRTNNLMALPGHEPMAPISPQSADFKGLHTATETFFKKVTQLVLLICRVSEPCVEIPRQFHMSLWRNPAQARYIFLNEYLYL